MITNIFWNLHDHCLAECSYCPTHLRGGQLQYNITDYIDITLKLISHYESLGRKIHWTFNGGEPLDLIDFPMMLKVCDENDGKIVLHTNGGRLWVDWWAMEPRVDVLHLSYHYWQNPSLIKYIIQLFQKKEKEIYVIVPIRPDHFDDDLQRALDIENEFGIIVGKSILYNNAAHNSGMFPYTDDQLMIIKGETLVNENRYFKNSTFKERSEKTLVENPSYTGMRCNTGIDNLYISHLGWASGSNCNNTPLGNLWINNRESASDAEQQQNNLNSLKLPTTPSICKMIACVSPSDQKIIKFNP